MGEGETSLLSDIWKRSCAIWFAALDLLIFKRVHLDVFWAASWQCYRSLWMASGSSGVNESVQLQGEVLGSQLRLIEPCPPKQF